MKKHSFMQNWILALIIIWGFCILGFAIDGPNTGIPFALFFTLFDLVWHFGYKLNFCKNRKRAKYLGTFIRENYYDNGKRKEEEFLFEEDYEAHWIKLFTENMVGTFLEISYPRKCRSKRMQHHNFEMDSAIEVYTYAKTVLKYIGNTQLKAYVYYGGYVGGNGKPSETSTYRVTVGNDIRNTTDFSVTTNVGSSRGSWTYVIGTEKLLNNYFRRQHYSYNKIYPRFNVR